MSKLVPICLRPYQTSAVADISAALKKHGNVLAVSPTGSGKTVIGAAVITAAYAGKRVLWIAHRRELLEQARNALRAAGLRRVGMLWGGSKEDLTAPVLVASIDMMRRDPDSRRFGLIVVDEAHRIAAKSYQDVLASHPRASVLGLTATPQRLDGKPLTDTFAHVVTVALNSQLIAGGYLVKPVTYGIPEDRARKMVAGLPTSGGDYAQGRTGARMMGAKLMGDVVSECALHAAGKRTIVFATTRPHAAALVAKFQKSGRSAEYLDGETSAAERTAILERFASGVTEVVVNVDILTEGYDLPAVGCIALCRPTKSRTRFLQYCGRASRPSRGKRGAVILDHAGNVYRHGLSWVDRDWEAGGEKGTGDPLGWRCSECGAMNGTELAECDECGAERPERPKTAREKADEKARLELIEARESDRRALEKRLRAFAEEKGMAGPRVYEWMRWLAV